MEQNMVEMKFFVIIILPQILCPHEELQIVEYQVNQIWVFLNKVDVPQLYT
jgi:hypothetical protein